jgi:hypothetical protein
MTHQGGKAFELRVAVIATIRIVVAVDPTIEVLCQTSE